MHLFSKRNEATFSLENKSFLKESLRVRLAEEIAYITTSEKFLERCFLVENEKTSKWYLDTQSMTDLSMRELGYDLSRYFNFEPTRSERRSFSIKKNDEEDSNDLILFDFIEILLIFCKEDKRQLVRERIQKHFSEEGNEYIVHDFLIARKDSSGIKPFTTFFKDRILREKFEQYFLIDSSAVKDYILLAKISAEILQFLLSGEGKKDTKSHTIEMVKDVAEKCVDSEKAESFSEILNKIILDAKSLNNEISNIRHTDRSTFSVDNPSLFRLIAANNLYLSELFVFSDTEKYFFSQKAIDAKEDYIKKYDIPVKGWIVPKPMTEEDDIKIEDVPF